MRDYHHENITEVAVHFLKEIGSLNSDHLHQLIWIADRNHLALYGNSITEDVYVAREGRGIFTNTLELLEAQEEELLQREYLEYFDKAISTSRYQLEANRKADSDYLAESHLAIINLVISTYKKTTLDEIVDIVKGTVEYEKALKQKGDTKQISELDVFENKLDSFLIKTDTESFHTSKDMWQHFNFELTFLDKIKSYTPVPEHVES